MAAEATPALLYLPALPEPGARMRIGGQEAHYIARVCRARAGERVEASDGRGALATLRVVEVRGEVVAEVERLVRAERARRAWVLCGAPEGDRADWLVEKLAELGVERFVPVEGARRAWRGSTGRRGRWERLAIAGLRQSRRRHLMEVVDPVPLERAVSDLPEGGQRWLAEPAGERIAPQATGGGPPAVGLIGPSGGLDEGERRVTAAAGFRPIRLSDARLRTETAALAWAVWWSLAGS